MTYRVPPSVQASPLRFSAGVEAIEAVPQAARASRGRVRPERPGVTRRKPPFRYAPVSIRDQPRDAGSNLLGAAALSAPFFGSRFLFPRRFDAAVAKLLERPDGAEAPPHHAFWYFGSALRLWVDPARFHWRLTDYVADSRGIRWIGSSFLDAGIWQGAVARVRRSPIHHEMTELIESGLDFRQTRTWRVWRVRAEIGRPLMRYGVALTSPERVEAYFNYCVDLVSSVREHGVMPRPEVRRLRLPRLLHRGVRSGFVDGAERDIGVAVNPRGMLIRHLGGKHRTAIAQALKLPLVPVEVRMVHVRWLAQQMARLDLPAHLALPAALAELADSIAGPQG